MFYKQLLEKVQELGNQLNFGTIRVFDLKFKKVWVVSQSEPFVPYTGILVEEESDYCLRLKESGLMYVVFHIEEGWVSAKPSAVNADLVKKQRALIDVMKKEVAETFGMDTPTIRELPLELRPIARAMRKHDMKLYKVEKVDDRYKHLYVYDEPTHVQDYDELITTPNITVWSGYTTTGEVLNQYHMLNMGNYPMRKLSFLTILLGRYEDKL